MHIIFHPFDIKKKKTAAADPCSPLLSDLLIFQSESSVDRYVPDDLCEVCADTDVIESVYLAADTQDLGSVRNDNCRNLFILDDSPFLADLSQICPCRIETHECAAVCQTAYETGVVHAVYRISVFSPGCSSLHPKVRHTEC